MKRLPLLLTLLFCLLGQAVDAHENQPALLQIKQMDNDRLELTFRTPLMFGQRHPVRLQLPEDWTELGKSRLERRPTSIVEYFNISTNGHRLDGSVLRFPDLEKTITDVFVRINRHNGTETTVIVRPSQPWLEIPDRRSTWEVARDYTSLGIEHILSGIDHLLFVLALMLIVSGWRRLLVTVTAFTLAHSVTLAAATLGLLWMPGPPVESVIALSILFLAGELVKVNRGESSLTARYPWVVAFVFGLLHGFGFAGALAKVGLPQDAIPLALLTFNIGVELGQLMFIAVVLVLAASLRKLHVLWPSWVRQAPAYGIGSVAAFWLIDRVSGF